MTQKQNPGDIDTETSVKIYELEEAMGIHFDANDLISVENLQQRILIECCKKAATKNNVVNDDVNNVVNDDENNVNLSDLVIEREKCRKQIIDGVNQMRQNKVSQEYKEQNMRAVQWAQARGLGRNFALKTPESPDLYEPQSPPDESIFDLNL